MPDENTQDAEHSNNASNSQPVQTLAEKLASLPFHPFVFAATAIIASLNDVKFGILWEEAIPAFVILELICAFAFAIFYLVLRDKHKVGLAGSAFIAWFMIYRAALEAASLVFRLISRTSLSPVLALVGYGILGIICLYALLKTQWHFGKKTIQIEHDGATASLNLVSVFILIFNFVPLFMFYSELEQLSTPLQNEMATEFKSLKLSAEKKPDIYFIMADGFPNSLTLAESWHCDNSTFIDFLRSRKFSVLEHSASNYDRTFYSLAATMNMQYLPDTVAFYKTHPGDNEVYDKVIQHSHLVQLLKQQGYRFVNVSSGDGATWIMPDADMNISYASLNMFSLAFFQLTPLFSLEKSTHIFRNLLAQIELLPGEKLAEITKIPGPKFVLIHTLLSHPPYIFDKNGEALPLDSSLQNQAGTPEVFLEQLNFATSQLEKWIDSILSSRSSSSGVQPIIILQSDHGPQFPTKSSAEFYNMRMRNLSACLFPDCETKPGESMTNVNTFRVLLNCYFHANLELLKNKAYCAKNADDFELKEIYSQLHFSDKDKPLRLIQAPSP